VLFDVTSMAGGQSVTMTSQNIIARWDKDLKVLKAVHPQAGNYVVNITTNEAEVCCHGSHYMTRPTNPI